MNKQRRVPYDQDERDTKQERPSWQGKNYIPAPQSTPERTVDSTATAMPITDMSDGFKGTVSPGLDSTSAVDRAQGFNRRIVLPMALTVILALVATLGWVFAVTLVRGNATLMPFMLDRLFVFLTVLGGMGYYVWNGANETDYAHTHAGKERLRLEVMRDVRLEEIRSESRLRVIALYTSLKLLGHQPDDDGLPKFLEMYEDE